MVGEPKVASPLPANSGSLCVRQPAVRHGRAVRQAYRRLAIRPRARRSPARSDRLRRRRFDLTEPERRTPFLTAGKLNCIRGFQLWVRYYNSS
jgi:hypothetical protein